MALPRHEIQGNKGLHTDIDRAASAAPASLNRFAGALLDVLDRLSCVRVDMADMTNPVYRLRYEAYRREEFVPFNDAGVVVDDLDEAPNVSCYGVMIDGELVSSIRLHHLTADSRFSPSLKVFPDVLEPMLDDGRSFIDPSRFTASHAASLAYPALPYLTLRLAVMASIFHGVDMCLALVRPEHTAFYRRVFRSEKMGDSRPYPGLAFPVELYGAWADEDHYRSIFSRFPSFLSTSRERQALFAGEPVGLVSPLVGATGRSAWLQAVAARSENAEA